MIVFVRVCGNKGLPTCVDSPKVWTKITGGVVIFLFHDATICLDIVLFLNFFSWVLLALSSNYGAACTRPMPAQSLFIRGK